MRDALVPLARKHGYRLRSIWTMLRGFDRPLQTIAIFTGRAGPGPKAIGVRGTGLRFQARDAMDVWCLKETLLDDLYQRHGFGIQPDWTILDIGAGIGDFTVLAATTATRGRVHACEPFPGSFELLLRNVEDNGVTNAHVRQVAVTGQRRDIALDLSSGEPLMIESVDVARGGRGGLTRVESWSLTELFERLAIDRFDLVKLDCEGAEYDILLNSPPGTIARIERIVMEYHDRVTEHTHHELVSSLQASGFRVETVPSPVHPGLIGYLRAWRGAAVTGNE